MELELKVKDVKSVEEIEFNYEELKKELEVQLKKYDGLVVQEGDVKEAKATRADLNRLAKAINDKKIALKKEMLQPLEDFEVKVKELLNLINKPCEAIDKQIKLFEEAEKKAKKEEIRKEFELIFSDYPKADFNRFFQEKWLNKTVKLISIGNELEVHKERFINNLSAIKAFGMSEEQTELLNDHYFKTNDMTKVIDMKLSMSRIVKEVTEAARNEVETEVTEVPEEPKVHARTVATVQSNASSQRKLTATFRVEGTKEELIKLGDYIKENFENYEMVKG